MSSVAGTEQRSGIWPSYRTVCRWHFCAGLFCIPFVIWLSVNGSIYLFRPQIETWLDRPHDHLAVDGRRASADAEVRAALTAVSGSNLHFYEVRPMTVVFHLHGELLMGDRGSMLVELAASWAIVMIVTGLYLWWPRNSGRLGGVLYPRLNQSGRVFWRDLHAVSGLWISSFVLVLLFTGLPWASSWGTYLDKVYLNH